MLPINLIIERVEGRSKEYIITSSKERLSVNYIVFSNIKDDAEEYYSERKIPRARKVIRLKD
ncbi:MAG: hypothetical protein ARM1_0611 [Candidatus Micrarchaeota archaeon]|nr:MAG: hypothetical protein ARM1_0611 [Candidatus Micrarchaeota archaeon]